MTNYTNTTYHTEAFADTCRHCKRGVHYGETVNDISGDIYHEKCWYEVIRDHAEANIIEPKAGQHCESCGYDLSIEGIQTVLDEDKVKCFHCVVEEGTEYGRTTI